MSVSIEFLQEEMMHELKGMEARIKGTKPVMDRVAKMMASSIELNFVKGGPPGRKWQKSKRAQQEGGDTLRLTGRLMNSITSRGYEGKAIAGTNVAYALAHQFGFKGSVKQKVGSHQRTISQAFGKAIDPKTVMVKAHNRTINQNIPARPFMELDPGDFKEAKEMIMQHIMGGAS